MRVQQLLFVTLGGAALAGAATSACSLLYRVDDLPASAVPGPDAAGDAPTDASDTTDTQGDAPPDGGPLAFLTTSGTHFARGGAPLLLKGFDLYQAAATDTCACGACACGAWGEPVRIGAALDDMKPGAPTATRVFFFQTLALKSGALDWSGFDAALAAARARGLYVIATLGNQWGVCDSTFRDESWYAGDYKTTTLPGQKEPYLQWVQDVVTRYKDDPTIGAWMLMNDAVDSKDCGAGIVGELQSFVSTVAGAIKAIDRNHLVIPGETGQRCATIDGPAWQSFHADPNVDACDVKEYDPGPNLSAATLARIAQCTSLGKPALLSEVGVTGDPSTWGGVDAGDLGGRAALLDSKFSSGAFAGIGGMLVWNWGCEQAPLLYDKGDPVLAKMAGWKGP
ncbi:MAG: hypothetical protein NVSMB47_17070 [Polyangiales bacterium]